MSGSQVLGVFIDYQPRNEELSEDEPYELRLRVVFDTTKPKSSEKAKTLTRELVQKLSENHGGLEVLECEALADTEFTLYDARMFFEFRLEYLSLRREPFGAIAEH